MSDSTTKKQLHVRAGGKAGGPFDWEQIRRGIQMGKLTPSHEASVDGQTWFRLETIWPELVGSAPEVLAEAAAGAASPSVPQLAMIPSAEKPSFGVNDRSQVPSADGPAVFETADAVDGGALPRTQVSKDAFAAESVADSPPGYAPAYAPSLFQILRLVSLFAGLVYVALALNSLYVVVVVKSAVGRPNELLVGAGIHGTLTVAAVLLDLATSACLLIWLNNVFQRLRAFHRKLGSESFTSWVFSYFVPVMSAFKFAAFFGRIWNAAYAGKRTKGVRATSPGVVAFGSMMRCLVWLSYFGVAAAFKWNVDVIEEKMQFRRNVPAGARYEKQVAEQLRAEAVRLDERERTSGLALLGAIAFAAASSAAVVFSIYGYANTVHRYMMAMQDPAETESSGASTPAT